jgi:hypothetical protein
MLTRRRAAASAFASAWLVLGAARAAEHVVSVRDASDRGASTWEPEAHLAFGASGPPARSGGYGAGVGARASVTLGSAHVSSRVDDWFALGFGLDLLHHAGGGSPYGTCVERTPAPAGTSVCTRVDAPNAVSNYLLVPVVAQWSFDVARPLSVFGELGIAGVVSSDGGGAAASFALGARYRVADAANAVLRLGWPLSTLGVSF